MNTNRHKNTHADLQRVPRDRAGEAERVALSQNTRRRNNSHCGCNCGETQRERGVPGGSVREDGWTSGYHGVWVGVGGGVIVRIVIWKQWAEAKGVMKWEGPSTSVSLATCRQSWGWEHLLVRAARRGSSCL